MSSNVVSGLVKKRAELSGLVQFHRKEIKKLAETIEHLDKTIKLFDSEIDLRTIKPVQKQNRFFKAGELSRYIIESLKNSSVPMSANDIFKSIQEIHDLDKSYIQNIRNVLNRLYEQGIIEKISDGKFNLWVLAP